MLIPIVSLHIINPTVDIINLPVKDAANADIIYTVLLNKSGYTFGNQPVFQHIAPVALLAGVLTLTITLLFLRYFGL